MTLKITLSPVRKDAPVTLVKDGDTLFIDGEGFDFSFLAEGDTLPKEAVSGDWLGSDVTRKDGTICLTFILPHGRNAPRATRFPDPATATITQDGPITLPLYNIGGEEL